MKEEIKEFIHHHRRQFKNAPLLEAGVDGNPFAQFDHWFEDAVKAAILDPYAMTLATASKAGIPAARMVYMRNISRKGLVFFTNYTSHKGEDLDENPNACVNFYWEELSRQVRITGSVEKVEPSESDEYFASRPRMSQIGAWASHQSKPLKNNTTLQHRIGILENRFENQAVARPEFWGGYILIPSSFEFWQGRDSRLHDRLFYSLSPQNEWNRSRLSP